MKLKQFDIDAVMVDLDGTMVDTLGDFVVALNLMLSDLPPPYRHARMERATVARLVGKGSEHLIKSVLSTVDAPKVRSIDADDLDPLFQLAWTSYQRHYLAINGQHALVYPGVYAGLERFKACGLKLACLTNKPTAFARALLELKSLDKFFAVTYGGDAFERKKPDPLPLLKACEAMQTLPRRTLMIGDSSNDASAARAAGCPVLLVTYGYNHGQPIHAVDADGYADSLEDLARAMLGVRTETSGQG